MLPFSRVSRVLRLGELALGCRLPLHGLRSAEFPRRFALTRRGRRRAAPLRETVLPSGCGELVDDGHLDVACSPLTLDGPIRAGHCSLAFAGEHDPELVAEVVLEVYEAGVWIDVLRSCVFLVLVLVLI